MSRADCDACMCSPTDAAGEPFDLAALTDDELVEATHTLVCAVAELADAAADYLRALVIELWAPDVSA